MASHVETDTVRNARNDAAAALLNGGYVVFETSGGAGILLTFDPLPSPAFGSSSSGSATLDNSPVLEAVASGTGTVAQARWYTSGDVLLWTDDVSTVSAGTGTIQIISTSIVSGETYQFDMSSYVLSQPAGT